MSYERCKFGCEWPIVKDSLFEEQCDFAVSRLPLEGFSWIFIPRNIHVSTTNSASVSHRLLINSTLLGDACAFSDTSRPPLEGLSWKFTPHTFHECATYTESFVSIDRKLRQLYWQNKVLLGLYISFRWRDFPET